MDTTDSIIPELYYTLSMKWGTQKFQINVNSDDTVGDLKLLIWSLTDVPSDRQKVLGLVKSKLPGDEVEVKALGLIEGKVKEFMMVGTPEGSELQAGPSNPLFEGEEEEDYSARESRLASEKAKNSARNTRKLQEACKLKIDIMRNPRKGKKLLVLDLDYAILDTALWKEENFIAEHFARPFLHEMLTILSPYYDIAFWSQTHWRWLEAKLVELEILGESARGNYPIVMTLDRTPMFSVYSTRHGKPFKHEVKALEIIWNNFKEFYSPSNTIHVDDLQRNFLLNEGNGLRVKAYKDAMNSRETDRELVFITKYLLQLVGVEDVRLVDHTKFKEFEAELPEGVEDPVKKMGLKIKKRKLVDEEESIESGGSSSNTSSSSGSGNGTSDPSTEPSTEK